MLLLLPAAEINDIRHAYYSIFKELLVARLHTVYGGQTSNDRWRLSSSSVVCNTPRQRNVTHQGAARDGGPFVLRPVRPTSCSNPLHLSDLSYNGHPDLGTRCVETAKQRNVKAIHRSGAFIAQLSWLIFDSFCWTSSTNCLDGKTIEAWIDCLLWWSLGDSSINKPINHCIYSQLICRKWRKITTKTNGTHLIGKRQHTMNFQNVPKQTVFFIIPVLDHFINYLWSRNLETSKNHHISAAVQAISTKFGTLVLVLL